jgi:pre-mRNA-processing factor SLU7
VWGSYFSGGSDGNWGYACCHQLLRNAYCTGAAIKDAKKFLSERKAANPTLFNQPGGAAAGSSAAAAAATSAAAVTHTDDAEVVDDGELNERQKAKLRREERKKRKAADGDDDDERSAKKAKGEDAGVGKNAQGYNQESGTGDPTEAEMESYYRHQHDEHDPMKETNAKDFDYS